MDPGELDLALVTYPSTHQRGEVIRMEQLYWVTSPRHHVHELEVVPLAIYHATSALRRIATEALEKAGRSYRIACSSSSHDALVGAVTAGLAVGFLPGCSLQPSLAIISERERFPPLLQFGIALIEGAGADEPHIKAMCRHIKTSLSNLLMAEP